MNERDLPRTRTPKTLSFAERVRRAMPEGYPFVHTIRVRPSVNGTPTEKSCDITYGPLAFSMHGKRLGMFKLEALTPEQVAGEIVKRKAQHDAAREQRAQSEGARLEFQKKCDAVHAEVPGAEHTWMWTAPNIPGVHGFGELRVMGLAENPGISAAPDGEPVFVVHGHFTVGALKQLLAGTMFKLRRRDWTLQELREKAVEEVDDANQRLGLNMTDADKKREYATRVVEMLTARGVPVLQAELMANV